MIEARVGELAQVVAGALIRPVASDFAPVTPAMSRFSEAAGPAVAAQCAALGELPLGSAAITAAGALPADFIIHVVVRTAAENATAAVVRQGLRNALRRAADWGIDVLALAPLGTGAGNLDAEESALAMVPVLAEHESRTGRPLQATIVVEDAYQKAVFEAAVARLGSEGMSSLEVDEPSVRRVESGS